METFPARKVKLPKKNPRHDFSFLKLKLRRVWVIQHEKALPVKCRFSQILHLTQLKAPKKKSLLSSLSQLPYVAFLTSWGTCILVFCRCQRSFHLERFNFNSELNSWDDSNSSEVCESCFLWPLIPFNMNTYNWAEKVHPYCSTTSIHPHVPFVRPADSWPLHLAKKKFSLLENYGPHPSPCIHSSPSLPRSI